MVTSRSVRLYTRAAAVAVIVCSAVPAWAQYRPQAYNIGIPVNSSLDWKAYRIGYEYDFLVRNQGFAGFILEAKYTDINVSLASPVVATQFAHARAPIPALGGIGRVYVVPNISITG